MPSRMPNWNMRANALVDGMPDDQALQDAELRVGLHDAHQPQHRVRRHDAVGIEHDARIRARCPSGRRNRGCCRP